MKIIIANTDTGIILKTADEVLKKHGNDGTIPEHIKGQTVLSVLKHLGQRRDWFSICVIQDLAKMNEIKISTEHMEFFRTLHCIHYADMHEDTKEYLMALLINYFRGNIVMANSKQAI